MEEEIEDIVGDVKYTDSQKSVATSIMYSPDFTDSSSDKNNSSGKDTYVIEWDSEDSSTEKMFPLHDSNSVINLNKERSLTPLESNSLTSRFTSSSLQKCSIVAQEIYTQTSKTIIELAETEGALIRAKENKTLETQTSFLSITENKTIEYRIEVSSAQNIPNNETAIDKVTKKPAYFNITCNQVFTDSIDEASSKFPISITDTDFEMTEDNRSDSSNDQIITLIKDDSREIVINDENSENCEYDNSEPSTDMEEDSLIANNDQRKSPNIDVLELREKLFENTDLHIADRYGGPDLQQFGTLTPLTEESAVKRDSLMDITPVDNIGDLIAPEKDEILFTSSAGMKVKLLNNETKREMDSFKLPPIQNQSCPNSPHLNSLFSANKPKLNKAGTLPCLYERQRDNMLDRWEIGSKNLASGESPMISSRSESPRKDSVQLPPIRTDANKKNSNRGEVLTPNVVKLNVPSEGQDSICIKDRIKELKMSSKKPWNNNTRHSVTSRADSRNNSPRSASPPEGGRLSDIADRGCEVLCVELLRRLGSTSWLDIIETLQEIPTVLEKFWGVISENRIADLIRQVNTYVESPRPQVSRAACSTVAALLKNTSFTKKPDFDEAITLLLIKTGSYSRPVRRAANVALDDVVCGVDLTHAVVALSVHGVEHKNALVRCAAARLLVVCCALAGGGRDLLRARPTSAASARRHVLRSLAALLEDKSTDTRKYAERLYSMLRPLANFEAYYLTDVDVDTASKQMKKYDQLLCGPSKENR